MEYYEGSTPVIITPIKPWRVPSTFESVTAFLPFIGQSYWARLAFATSGSAARTSVNLAQPSSSWYETLKYGALDMLLSAGPFALGRLRAPMPVPSGTTTATDAAEAGKRIALGIEDHLDAFAKANGAESWKQFAKADPMNWKTKFLELMNEPNTEAVFNLKDVKVWDGILRASRGAGGATDWELLQIQQNSQWWSRIKWVLDGELQPNPFQ